MMMEMPTWEDVWLQINRQHRAFTFLTFDFHDAVYGNNNGFKSEATVGRECFCRLLMNSCTCRQAMAANDKWAEFWHECWLIFSFMLMSKKKLKRRRRHTLEFHSFISDISDFFAESGNNFWIWEYYLQFLCYSQCSSYKYNKLLSSIGTVNIFSIT